MGVLSRPGLVVLVALMVVAVGRPVAAQSPLRGPQGPYRGRVIEAGSGQPIAGAGVFIVWPTTDGGGEITPFGYREAQTDAQGEFSIEATSIEPSLPPRALQPTVLDLQARLRPLS